MGRRPFWQLLLARKQLSARSLAIEVHIGGEDHLKLALRTTERRHNLGFHYFVVTGMHL
jgi:hypothetical protein